jgi:hypothetical protein
MCGGLNMGKNVVFDNGKMTIWYYDDYKIIHHRFNKLTYGQYYKDGFLKGLEVMKENNAVKWLSDNGETQVLRKEDLEWAAENWRPKMIEAGWKYWAVIKPESAAGKLLFDKFIKMYEKLGVTLKFFDDVDTALTWLKEQ